MSSAARYSSSALVAQQEDTDVLVQVDAIHLQVMWPTRLLFGSYQKVCQLLEAVLAGSNVVVGGSF